MKRLIDIGFTLIGIVLLVLPAVLAIGAIRAYTNRLVDYPDWECSKRNLEYIPAGSIWFHESRQALAGNNVDLGAWHGFQEVSYASHASIDALSLRARVSTSGYLAIYYYGDGERREGLFLSRRPERASRWFTTDEQGKFLDSTPVNTVFDVNGDWVTIALTSDDSGRVTAAVAGTQLSPNDRTHSLNMLGLRGSRAPVFVDDVRIHFSDGSKYVQDFSHSNHQWARGEKILSIWLAILLSIAVACWFRTRSLLKTLFACVMASLVAAFAAGTAWAYFVQSASIYPERNPSVDPIQWMHDVANAEDAEAIARYEATKDLPHILILGTSQTAGQGAAKKGERYVDRLESQLTQRLGAPVVCLSLGFQGAQSDLLLEHYERNWLQRRPDLVLVDLSNNDHEAGRFQSNLEKLVEISRAEDIPVVFALEPNSPEVCSGDLPNHRVMRDVGQRLDVPALELHNHIKTLDDTGFLWWDNVHPTSYGHALIGEFLAKELNELGMLEALKESTR